MKGAIIYYIWKEQNHPEYPIQAFLTLPVWVVHPHVSHLLEVYWINIWGKKKLARLWGKVQVHGTNWWGTKSQMASSCAAWPHVLVSSELPCALLLTVHGLLLSFTHNDSSFAQCALTSPSSGLLRNQWAFPRIGGLDCLWNPTAISKYAAKHLRGINEKHLPRNQHWHEEESSRTQVSHSLDTE